MKFIYIRYACDECVNVLETLLDRISGSATKQINFYRLNSNKQCRRTHKYHSSSP